MPFKVTAAVGAGADYGNPFVGRVDHSVGIQVTLTAMTAGEIDKYGYLKPGIPLTKAGAKIGIAPEFVYGVTAEAVKVADNNLPATIAALTPQEIAVVLIGAVNQDIAEDNLGRAYTADEIAGFDRAGSKIVLI